MGHLLRESPGGSAARELVQSPTAEGLFCGGRRGTLGFRNFLGTVAVGLSQKGGLRKRSALLKKGQLRELNPLSSPGIYLGHQRVGSAGPTHPAYEEKCGKRQKKTHIAKKQVTSIMKARRHSSKN